MLAGESIGVTKTNDTYYLYTNQDYWTMTPHSLTNNESSTSAMSLMLSSYGSSRVWSVNLFLVLDQ